MEASAISSARIPKSAKIFTDISEDDVKKMLSCLKAYEKRFSEGDIIVRTGDVLSEMGLVLSGSVYLEKDDFWGNRSILSTARKGETFGEIYAELGEKPSSVTVTAAEKTEVLFLNLSMMTAPCSSVCPCHTRLIRNLVSTAAEQAYLLTEKMEHLSKRTTRRKILSYLSQRAEEAGSSEFTIPFDRQELADYLFVERSALSYELGRMRREGVIDFRKNRFELKRKEEL
jgi:CRP-like cAMP-binding protein